MCGQLRCAHVVQHAALTEQCFSGNMQEAHVSNFASSFYVWDSVFFRAIASSGYEFEQYLAFFPGLPGSPFFARRSVIIVKMTLI